MRLKPWPIIAGILIATIGSFLVGLLYFASVFGVHLALGTPPENVALHASEFASLQLLNLIVTCIGGFVAARMARLAHLQHGASVGVASLLAWLVVDVTSPSEGTRMWSDVAAYVAEIPAGALGGYFAARANRPLQPTSGAGLAS